MTNNIMNVRDGGKEPDRLLIDIPRNELGTFLSSLLGQPRRVEKVFDRPFNIDHGFLLNLDQIIDQRIMTQQKSTLTAFSARVSFADGRIQTETSRDAFRSINDISDSPTNGVELTWTYLIWFPNRPTPERQEILLRISADENERASRELGPSAGRQARDALFSLDESRSLVRVVINHTELTWGIDVLNYIENELKKRFYERGHRSKIGFWLRAFSPVVAFASISIVPMVLLSALQALASERARQVALVAMEKAPDTLGAVVSALKYLMQHSRVFAQEVLVQFGVYYLSYAMVITGIMFYFWPRRKSFVVLNDAAKRQSIKMEERAKHIWWAGVVAFWVGVVAGVAGNKLTALIDKLF